MAKETERLKNGPEMDQEVDLYSLVRKNSPYVALERTLVPIINFLITVYIIRVLTVDDYGIYKLLLAVLSYVALLSSLGTQGIFRRFIPEFFQKKELPKLKALVEKGLLLRMVVCIGIVVVIIVFAKPIGNLFKFQRAMEYFAIFSVSIIFNLAGAMLANVLISVFRHKQYLVAQIIYVLFRGGILYILLSRGMGLMGLLIAESASYALLFVMSLVIYRKFLHVHSVKERAKLPLRRLLKFGGFTYFNEAGAQLLSVSTDYLIISAFLGPLAVGIYGFANRVMVLAARILPQSMFVNIIRPAFYMKYIQNEDADQTNRMFNFLTKMIAFFAVPLVLGIVVLGDKLILHVFDPKYMQSLNVLWIVAAFHSFNYFMDPIAIVLESKEKVQVLLYSKIFAIYNLVGNLLVVKPYGVMGIAVVTGTSIMFKNLFCYFYARKVADIKLEYKGLFIVTVNALIMTVVILLLRSQVHSLLTFVLVVLAGGGVYLAASYLNKAFTSTERKILNRVLPRPFFVF